MGLAFKTNIDDLRESPAKYIIQQVLQNSNDDYFIAEPNIKSHPIYKLTDFEKACEKVYIIAFLVAHKQFKNLQISSEKIVLDFCGVFY